MRYFAKPGGIERLSFEARVVYTFFCSFMLLGYASSAWFWSDDDLGFGPSSAVRYYLGDATGAADTTGAEGGPALDLPDEAAPLRLAKPPRQIVETFHFHLFSVSVCFLILGHLFMMCALPTRLKVAVIAAAGISALAHLIAPPAIRFVSPSFAVLMAPTAIVMGLSWLWMTVHPIVEMWTKTPSRAGRDSEPKSDE